MDYFLIASIVIPALVSALLFRPRLWILQKSYASILSIAMAVGFNARSSFYKAFKTNTGMTPAQYRAHPAEQEHEHHE